MFPGGCQLTYQSSSLTTMGPTGTFTQKVSAQTTPGTRLQAQLEHLHTHCGGRILDVLKYTLHTTPSVLYFSDLPQLVHSSAALVCGTRTRI